MCGIAGFWDLNNKFRPDNLKNIIVKMRDCLKERGPDDSNYWIDHKNNLGLGHTRLSIIETSILGRQPMISQNKRYVIVFNGEIYNFSLLKEELQNNNIKTKSYSDTEILLEACSYWGVKKTLLKLSGMFAFVLLDKKIMKLYLVRDKFGIKPLYYSLKNKIFLFSSQTKSFLKHPKWKKEICLKTLGDYLRYGYVPTGKSIYKNTAQVLPGHYLIFQANGSLKTECYWNIRKNINEKKNITVNDIENMLESSVKEHMVSDVPIGSFLSGGIDSSLITSLMQKNSIKPIETFSIGFHDKSLDESSYANSVANHLKTNHNQAMFSNKDLINLIPKINNIYDEPFADSSQLPTILLSKITRKKVKVALSGDGGDELFGGYNRYNWAKKIKLIYKFPKFLRLLFFNAIQNISTDSWDKVFKNIPYFNKIQFAGDKLYKLADVLNLNSFSDVYPNLISQWKLEEIPLLKNNSYEEEFNKNFPSLDIIKQMQLADILTYLPGDILTKVDRASMSFGLEVRVPFLQNELIDNIWSIKDEDKKNKNILKKILYKYVPKKLVARPKMGFSIPLDKWLRGPLKEWADDLLEEKKLEENFLDSKKIKIKWKEHLSEKRNWQYPLWTILIYQSWKNC